MEEDESSECQRRQCWKGRRAERRWRSEDWTEKPRDEMVKIGKGGDTANGCALRIAFIFFVLTHFNS